MITRIRRNSVVSISMEKLLAFSVLFFLLIVVGESRELRPSEHGLTFQNLPARSPDMILFFGEQESPPEKNPPSPGILERSNETAEADTWWRESPGKREENNKVRKVLLIATVVCGGTGVVLLLAAAFLFAVHFYRQRSEISSASSVVNNNANANHSAAAPASAASVTVATVPDSK